MSEDVWSAVSEHFIKLIKSGVVDRTHFRLSGGEPLTCFDSWREFPPYLKKTSTLSSPRMSLLLRIIA